MESFYSLKTFCIIDKLSEGRVYLWVSSNSKTELNTAKPSDIDFNNIPQPLENIAVMHTVFLIVYDTVLYKIQHPADFHTLI